MKKFSLLGIVLLALFVSEAPAQTAPVVGLRQVTTGTHALLDARIVVAPGTVIERGNLIIRDGVIEDIGPDARVPADARVWNAEGRTIYPGFIDAYSGVGMPEDTENDNGPVYWNPQVRPFVDAASVFSVDASLEGSLRGQGITTALAVPQLGMFRGLSAVVSLGDGPAGDRIIRSGIAQSITMRRDGSAGGGYPTSQMGAISLIRQTLLDADWYVRAHAAYERNRQGLRRPETDMALAALAQSLDAGHPFLFEARNEEDVLRAMGLAEEFGLPFWVRGSGSEYRILDALEGFNSPLILPVPFPSTPNINPNLPEATLGVSLTALRHWHLAPETPARLAQAGIEFVFTSDGLGNRSRFLQNIRQAVDRGLDEEVALAALTTRPARLLGIQQTHGTLETGKVANLVVSEGDLFTEAGTIRDVWVDGHRFEISTPTQVDPRGRWIVTASDDPRLRGDLRLAGTVARLSGNLSGEGRQIRLNAVSFAEEPRRLRFTFDGDELEMPGLIRVSATVSGNEMFGWGELPDGNRVNWHGERRDTPAEADRQQDRRDTRRRTVNLPVREVRPNVDYGFESIPERPEQVLVRNATIWTAGPQGKLEHADLLVRQGRIAEVGRQLEAPAGAIVIDAAGKHVTPGLIDPHLHSGATGGINETGNAIVPEVRLSDMITMQSAWMYRQLAGGLTTAGVLHGSANPIGGQNQTVKMRWGALPEDIMFEDAPRTLKFALGENVKRSTGRYPNTRMGTDQIIRDNFQAAVEYRDAWQEWERSGNGIPPRRDLRMEALVDVLNGDMQVHVHAYRADEMIKMMRIAEDFGFKVHTFEHTLEGYKMADELREHGAAAVVWTDWHSFKVESYDGITYNARLLLEAGVRTSLHSDNSQISTRMNWEAGKLLRTGVSEEDALAMVTIKPAYILGIEDRVGSLEPGKDADFVIWSGHPLSTFTRAEQTWVDGRKYFDIEQDRVLRDDVRTERATLIQHILNQR